MSASSVQELFEAQAAKTPDAVAVAFGDANLTYRELDERSNQLAHSLIRLGVGPEVLVGVYLLRCPELLVGLLGVLKAGGAFLPLDPEGPGRRLSFMLEDAGARFLLTHPPLLGSLPRHETLVVCLDPDRPREEAEPRHSPPSRTGPDSLAYLMYTSGSTGRPKGILVPQRGLVNYLSWCLEAYPVAAGTGAPVHSSIAFDLTLTSLFAPLLAGRTVRLLPQGNAIDLLRAALRAEAPFSLVKITPAHLELLGQILEPHEAPGRTHAFIIGGENLTDRHLAFWQEFAPETLLVNEYGPTETVVGCSVFFLPPGKSAPGSVPIGRPIADTRLFVLDDRLLPVGPGAEGELYIGGAGLARGYHNRPDLTAERFVPDPFGPEPGARLYRTGDRARVLPDGNLEFLGRADGQVKIRGFRIETEEVEGALREHPSVRQAVVLAREDVPGEKRLVAYVVPRPERALSRRDLRAHLSDRLQHFMIPADLVFLDALPLTPNGKVDRRALPVPERALPDRAAPLAPSASPLQARMVSLWEEVLGARPIGVRDNFFELGGESLQAVRLFTRIRKVFGRDLPLASLLGAPTVEQLVRLLDAPDPQGVVSLVPLRTGGSRPPLFCAPGSGGDVLELYELAGLLGPEQPVYGLQTHGRHETHALPRSLEELAARCLEVMRSVQPDGPYFLSGFSFGATVAFEMARQLVARGQGVGFLAVLDQHACSPEGGARFRPNWLEVLKNLPRWVRTDLWRLNPAYLLRRLGRRAEARLRWLARLFRPGASPAGTAGAKGATPAPADRRESLMDYHRYHIQLQSRYVPGAYPGRVTLLKAEAQPHSTLFDALFAGHDLGWGRLAQGGAQVILIPGSHHSILKKPDVFRLAERLRRCLDRAQGAAADRAPVGGGRCPPAPLGAPPPAMATEPTPDEGAEGVWRVVVNHEGQYSIWTADRPCPAGWRDAGPSGARAECLAHIREAWVDLRPLSIRGGPLPGQERACPTTERALQGHRERGLPLGPGRLPP